MRGSRLAVITLIGLSIACGDDDDHRIAVSHACNVEQPKCDIEKTSCLDSLLDLAACTRQDKRPPLPEVQTITSAELAAQLHDEVMAMGYGPTPWDALLPKLHLLPDGKSTVDSSIDLLSQSVAAFYDDEKKNITIVTDADTSDVQEKMYLVLHELTHYLQDRASDLRALSERAGDSADAHTALTALVEGEAVVNSTRGLSLLLGHAPQTLDWYAFFDNLDQSFEKEVRSSDSPLLAAEEFLPYSVGGRFVADVWEEDGREYVDELFDEWPHAFCDWMLGSPWKSGTTSQVPLDCGPPLAPDGFTLYELDSLGATGAYGLLVAAGNRNTSLARALQNDAFAVYVEDAGMDAPGTARSIGVWRLRFKGMAGEFTNAIAPLGLHPQTFGNEVVIRVSSDDSLTELTGAALMVCPKLEDLKPMKPETSLPSAVRRLFH